VRVALHDDPVLRELATTPLMLSVLTFIMVLCLLVYRLAEFRLRSRLAQTRAVHSRSSAQTEGASHDALGFSMF